MGQKPRILIIDDSREIVAALKVFFERKYEILTAHNGFDGLQAFEDAQNSIDLVITDLVMPEFSGVGVINILRKKYPGIPIVAMTGWKGDIESRGANIDADQLFEKPFEISDLDKSISELLTNRCHSPFPG
jgi:DNA-binding response OmpR family regulator